MPICQHGNSSIYIDLGSCDAVELAVPDDPALLVSNDRLSLSPSMFFSVTGWRREASHGTGGIFGYLAFSFSSAQ